MQASNRKQQGFTLVEVIVVAVIVAALAAVSVPLYLNYVNSSRTNSAANTAGSTASFIGACRNQGGYLTATNATEANWSTATTTPVVVTCNLAAGNTTITIPLEIHVNISSFGNATTQIAAGTVQARHNLNQASVSTYSF